MSRRPKAESLGPSEGSVSSQPGHAPPHEAEDLNSQSVFGLVRKFTDELSTLFRQELALATAEITRSLRMLLVGAGAVAAGGAVLFAGLLLLLAAAVLGLATVVYPWLSALIIGVVVAFVGYLMIHLGTKRVSTTSVKPSMTVDSLRRDKEVLTRRQ
jgi:uncharacterized membrane protein YqjE